MLHSLIVCSKFCHIIGPPEEITAYLVQHFKAAFIQARGHGQFHRTRLREKGTAICKTWQGEAVGISHQIPLEARETCFNLTLYYIVKSALAQATKDPSATPLRSATIIALLGVPGTGEMSSLFRIALMSDTRTTFTSKCFHDHSYGTQVRSENQRVAV